MTTESKTVIRCAIYTRKSSEEGLEQSFNSLDAQREACEAFIASQSEGGRRQMALRGGHSYTICTPANPTDPGDAADPSTPQGI